MNDKRPYGVTKKLGHKNKLDKFYTKRTVAEYCVNLANVEKFNVVIEPSAGDGAFAESIEKKISEKGLTHKVETIFMDIHPESKRADISTSGQGGNISPLQPNVSIVKKDWFSFELEEAKEKILVVGNPPFGQQNNLAIKFFNHAAKFADRIAFIIPASFSKDSIQDRLDRNFHLTHQYSLPEDSFILNEESYSLKTVFQIWDKKQVLRDKSVASVDNPVFNIVSKTDKPDAVIQRIGGRAGKASSDWSNKNTNSNYFIQFKHSHRSHEETIALLNEITYKDRDATVGPRSISKPELHKAVTNHVQNNKRSK